MKKNPIHFYWGRKNGLVVTREDAEGNHPEVVFVSNQLSLDKLKKTGVRVLSHPPGRTVPVLAHQPTGTPHCPSS